MFFGVLGTSFPLYDVPQVLDEIEDRTFSRPVNGINPIMLEELRDF